MASPYLGHENKLYIGTSVVGNVIDWSYSQQNDEIESTSLGAVAKTYKTGLGSGTFTANFYYDPADATQNLLRPSSTERWIGLSFESAASAPVVSGLCSITSFEANGSVGSLVQASITARGFISVF